MTDDLTKVLIENDNLRKELSMVRKKTLEEVIKICQYNQRTYLDSGYAINQPMSSFGERFALGQLIEKLSELIKNS